MGYKKERTSKGKHLSLNGDIFLFKKCFALYARSIRISNILVIICLNHNNFYQTVSSLYKFG